VPTYAAVRELPVARAAVWAFVAEPYNLPEWWAGVAGVEPDRRGLAPGARWRVVGPHKPSYFLRPELTGTLLVLAVEPEERLTFQLTGDRLEVQLRLRELAPGTTEAELTVEGPWLGGLSRRTPQTALARLAAAVQPPDDPS
jgi:uncharacterized protein YndB with AHSA1/START domain